MDGVHDIGGIDGFGPVDATPSASVFTEEWERRAKRATIAVNMFLPAGGPRFRHSIERMDPGHYLTSSYYEHWLTGAASLLVEAGKTTQEELERRAGGSFPLSRPDRGTLPDPVPTESRAARFSTGDRVRVREWHPLGHTRAPRYVQGKRGVIARVDEAANLPDVEGHGGGLVLNPTYSVRFSAEELWGEGAEGDVAVHVDLFEHYLEEDA